MIDTVNLNTRELFDKKTNDLQDQISKALNKSTDTFKIKNNPPFLLTLPQQTLILIKQKRKIARIMAKNKTQTLKTLFNMLNRKTQTSINHLTSK